MTAPDRIPSEPAGSERARDGATRLDWRVWLAIAFLVILPMPPLVYNGYALLLGCLGIIAMARTFNIRFSSASARQATVLFACLWVPIAISWFDAADSYRAGTSGALYIRFLPMALFLCLALDRLSASVRLRQAVALVCTFYVVDAGWQGLTGHNIIGNPAVGPQLTGMFYPKLQLGVVLAVLTPVILAEIEARSKSHPAWWLAVVPLAVVVALTLHRNSWVVFALALFGFIALRVAERRWRIRGKTLAWVAGITLVFSVVAIQHLSFKVRLFDTVAAALVEHEQLEIQLGQRPDIWRAAFNMYQANWLNGVGVRGFRGVYPDYAVADDYWRGQDQPVSPAHPHQLVLEVAAETGTLGLLGYVLVIAIAIASYFRAPSANRHHAGPWLLAALLLLWPLNINKAFYGFFIATFFWWVLAVYVATLHAQTGIREPAD
ncbi:MAG: O-antigen ligase family protein [Pseudomonadota bacterium]